MTLKSSFAMGCILECDVRITVQRSVTLKTSSGIKLKDAKDSSPS